MKNKIKSNQIMNSNNIYKYSNIFFKIKHIKKILNSTLTTTLYGLPLLIFGL